jgi:hypothetical protein
MQTYILLVNFTDQGMRKIKDTIGRADAFEVMAKTEWRYHQSAVLDDRSLRCRCGFRSA